MLYASTFLSHSSVDKPLVEKVAHELGRRGVIAWLDKNELQSGASLSIALQEAIRRQATVTVFLSEAAIKSRWVEDELAAALQKDDASHERERIIPIYLGEPVSLVSSHPLLRNRWLHPDGDRVDRLGIVVPSNTDPLLLAQSIACEVASRVYSTLKMAEKRDIIIYLDQRGTGIRRSEPENIPENVRQLDAPVLVFRPNLSSRSPDETVYGKVWQDICLALESSLAAALGTPRWSTPKKIRILGNSQLGLGVDHILMYER